LRAVSPRYRRLASVTALATFVLIVIGGIVRVSDSGLGCGAAGSGFHGWPLCRGDLLPGLDLNTVIEYTHRATASVVGLLFFALAIGAWRRHRGDGPLVRATLAAAALVVAQGVLGGVVVEENLEEVLVASHLGLAMLLLALAIFIVRRTRPPGPGWSGTGAPPRGLAAAAQGAVLATIVAGGYMAGTQKYGRADYQLGDGAHHACGREFPTCNGDFLPFGQARLVDIHLTHRVLMFVATVLVIALAVAAIRRAASPAAARTALVLLAVLAAQLLLGMLNVWLEEYELLIVAHLALGTLLWAGTFNLALDLRGPKAALA